ncbi:MAG: glycosyltransferase family 4 protein [Burkholderiaceae bacterium]|nr:glycosyltransferase family 4 protein [Burkholderiaceae bacterium]
MNRKTRQISVLYSFPHRLGAQRICYTAWQQVNGLAQAGANVHVMAASIERPVPASVKVTPTLTLGSLRIPFRLIGNRRAFALHDHLVAKRLESLRDSIDVVHTWPQGARRTLEVAAKLGIPTVLERPNAHTRFAYETVRTECDRIGVPLPPGHEHAFDEEILRLEEEEYERAFRLLCPSDFVVETFRDKGFASEKLIRHIYGFDETTYYPPAKPRSLDGGLVALFVGVCAVRKGVHLALQAWLDSPAHRDGKFLIAGEFLPAYESKLSSMLAHPSVYVLGHRTDVPDLMRQSDILLLPSIEEGFGLVCTEAMGSGCVPLVSDACTDLCRHMDNALVHHAGDVAQLTEHIERIHDDRHLLASLRSNGLLLAPEITWRAAGQRLRDAYCDALDAYRQSQPQAAARDATPA